MQVRELIKLLQAQKDLDAEVCIQIASPVDSAWTKAELSVSTKVQGVCIEGYVHSDDPTAFFPGLAEGD